MPKLLLIAIVALAMSSCASISKLEEDSARHTADIESLRSITAENTAAVNDLRSDVNRLNGLLEEIQYTAKDKTEQLERTLQRVSARVPPPPGVPEDLLNQDDTAISRITSPAAEQFRQGLQQLRDGDFEAARGTFSGFVGSNPNTAFTDNGYFWLGVAEEKLGNLDRAIGSYSEAFQRFPAEDRVAPALYRLAQVFVNLGSKKEAVLTLQKLVDEHSNTEYGRKGRALLTELAPAKSAAPAPKKKR